MYHTSITLFAVLLKLVCILVHTNINNISDSPKWIAYASLALPCCLWKDHIGLCQWHPDLLGHLHVFVSKTHELLPFDQSQSPCPSEGSYLSLKQKGHYNYN